MKKGKINEIFFFVCLKNIAVIILIKSAKIGPLLPEIITVKILRTIAKILKVRKSPLIEKTCIAKQKSVTPIFPNVIVLIAILPLSRSEIAPENILSIFKIESNNVINVK